MDVSAGSGTIRPVKGKLNSPARRPSPSAAPRRRKKGGKGGLAGYHNATRSLAVSLVLSLPLLVIYNLGELFPASRMTNGLDLLTRLVGTQWGMYGVLIMNVVIGLASLVLAAIMIKRGRIRPWYWPALVGEGIAWAFVLFGLGWLLTWAMDGRFLPSLVSLLPRSGLSPGQVFTASAGAGYWEEIFFRLGLVGLPLWLGNRIMDRNKAGIPPRLIFGAVLLVGSAVVFSAMHYVGDVEQPEAWSFFFRVISGLLFGLLFLFRGLSAATWAHFVYDVIVFWNMGPASS